MTTIDHVSLKTANLLKEVNSKLSSNAYYDEEGCFSWFSERDFRYGCDNVRQNQGFAPLLYSAQKWLRNEHNIHAQATVRGMQGHYVWVIYVHGEKFYCTQSLPNVLFDTYEQSLDDAVAEACKLIIETKQYAPV